MNRSDLLQQFQQYSNRIVHYKTRNKLKRLNDKFKVIKERQCHEVDRLILKPEPIDNFVRNLSSVEFSEKQLSLLNKGLKFSIPPIKPPIEDLIVAVQSQTKNMDEEVRSKVIQVIL